MVESGDRSWRGCIKTRSMIRQLTFYTERVKSRHLIFTILLTVEIKSYYIELVYK